MRLLRLSLILLVGAQACAKRADEAAPSETAASQAPMPGAAPMESPAAEAPPPPPAPAATPDSLEKKTEEKGGLAAPEREYTNLAEAQKAFDESSQELDKLLGKLGAQGATPLAGGDGRCPQACKAFASLERAGDAICRLAGDTNQRCTKAREVVKQNKARVSACGCDDD